jgi:hypothetical protein
MNLPSPSSAKNAALRNTGLLLLRATLGTGLLAHDLYFKFRDGAYCGKGWALEEPVSAVGSAEMSDGFRRDRPREPLSVSLTFV